MSVADDSFNEYQSPHVPIKSQLSSDKVDISKLGFWLVFPTYYFQIDVSGDAGPPQDPVDLEPSFSGDEEGVKENLWKFVMLYD